MSYFILALFGHAVDCLNRSTGPPDGNSTSYESLTGDQPKVMPILPFGCRAYPVKPRPQYSKTSIDRRAWLGINCGREPHTPGAYNIWLPEEGKMVCTSDVYFDDGLMPWLPMGQQRVADPIPVAPPSQGNQATGLPEGLPGPPPVPKPAPSAEGNTAFQQATRGAQTAASRSLNPLPWLLAVRPIGCAASSRRSSDAALYDVKVSY